MIRINLQIDQAVSRCLYESLCELPGRQRAERVRVLATLGLHLEGNPGRSGNELPETDSAMSTSLLATDIAKALGES